MTLAGSLLPPVAVLVCQQDKGRREAVLTFLPLLGWTRDMNHSTSWFCPFTQAYAEHGHMYSDFQNRAGGASSRSVITEASRWLTMADGEQRVRMPAAGPKAAKAVEASLSMSIGKDRDWLQERRLSGTHSERHVQAVVTAKAGWPDGPKGQIHADALGDWAPPPGSQPTGRGKPKGSRALYVPNSSLKTQMEARARFAYLMQAAFSLWDIDGTDASKPSLTWETTWDDVIPKVPPAALRPFYGEPTDELYPELSDEAALVGVTFSEPLPPRRQGATATRKRRRASH